MSTPNCWEIFFEVNDVNGNFIGRLSFPGPCVIDDCSDLMPNATVVPRLSDQCSSEFDVNWSFDDSCGNSVSFIQKILITDQVAPQWTSPNPLIINGLCSGDVNQLIADNIPTVQDNCDAIVIEYDRTVITENCREINIIEYETMDSCGNLNPERLQVRIEISDNVPPVWIQPQRDTIFECDGLGNQFDLNAWLNESTDPGNVMDECGTATISFVQVATTIPDTCAGQIELIYEFIATDGCGNTNRRFGFFHILDNTPPVVVCPADVDVNCDEPTNPFITGVAVVNDACNFNLFATFTDNSVFGFCPGPIETINRTWTAIDPCGNTSSCNQMINIPVSYTHLTLPTKRIV